MSEEASEVTRIQIRNDEMYVNGVTVITVSPRKVFMSFLYFLKLKIKKCMHTDDSQWQYI